jgi:hypothetical protein
MEHDFEKEVNMKLILYIFEQLFGFKINFHKSKIFCFEKAKKCEEAYKEIFGCGVGSLPFKYLGIPIHYRRLLNSEWKPVEDRFERKLGCLIGKLLSYRDHLILINFVLTSPPMEKTRFLSILLFWQSDHHKEKYRLTKWNIKRSLQREI